MQSKKVGIVTYTRSNNYGARLQAYAVYKIMKDMGFDAEIIDVDYPKRYYKYVVGRILNLSDSISEWFGKYVITYKMLRFNKRNIGATRHIITRSTDKMCEFINNQGYDAVICGSDEIWSSRTREIAPPSIYFLPEKINALKIAFSPSANGNHVFKEAEKKWLKCNLEAYSLLGVRDEMTLALVRDELRIEKAELIYDPTLYQAEKCCDSISYERVPLSR